MMLKKKEKHFFLEDACLFCMHCDVGYLFTLGLYDDHKDFVLTEIWLHKISSNVLKLFIDLSK